MQPEAVVEILSLEQLSKYYSELETKCQQMEDFEDPGVTNQVLIQKFATAQKYITQNQMFSENEKLKEIQTQHLRFLTLPFYIGFLYGRVGNPRRQAIQQSKNYLEAYLSLLETFNSQQQQIFPTNALKTWLSIKERKDFNFQRDQVIANHKQKKLIEQRYKNKKQIKDEGDQRDSIKDFLMLKIFQSITQLKCINQEVQMLQYKATLEKDPEVKKKHEEEQQKPVPKMKIWEVKKKEEIQSSMCPHHSLGLGEKKKELVAQVWQQNANKPTMTLEQVAQLQINNMHARSEREKKQRQENKQDSDSDKEEVDVRKKKEAENWDTWKEHNEKGAGNKGSR